MKWYLFIVAALSVCSFVVWYVGERYHLDAVVSSDWTAVDFGEVAPKEQVYVGLCQGMFQNWEAQMRHDVALFAAALPERHVVGVPMSGHCERWADEMPHLDVMIAIGNEFPGEINERIRNARNSAPASSSMRTAATRSTSDLLSYPKNSVVVPHVRGRVFLMGWHGEANPGYNSAFDVLVNTNWANIQLGAELYYPLASRYFYNGEGYPVNKTLPEDLVLKVDFDAQRELDKKERFGAFLHYVCDTSFYSGFAATRVALYDALKDQYKGFDSLGGCRFNHTVPAHLRPAQYTGKFAGKGFKIQQAVDAFTRYKFVIAFENNPQEGYFTEKLVNAVLAGSVPVYAGVTDEPFVGRFVNTKRFIYCKFDRSAIINEGFDNRDLGKRVRLTKESQREALRICVEKIRLVDQDDELYKHMISQPFLPGNKVEGSLFDLRRIAANVRQALIDHKSYLVAVNNDSDVASAASGQNGH